MSARDVRSGWSTWWPWLVTVLAYDVTVASMSGSWAAGVVGLPSLFAQVFMLTSFLGSGALLLSRRRDHPVSWLLPLPAVYLALDSTLDVAESIAPAAATWLTWVTQVAWAPTFVTTGIFLPLLFPTGRLPSERWRWLAWIGTATVVLLTVGNGLATDLLKDHGLVNPVGLAGPVPELLLGLGVLTLAISFVSSMIAAVVRFRRSVGTERQQLRWFVRCATLLPIAWAVAIALEHGPYQDYSAFALGIALSLLPVAVTVAVLRYRLYDIDRVVSRTVSYAALTMVLAGVYAGLVLGGQALLGSRADAPDVLIAGATLLVAAIFQPLRRRIQVRVDRRFARARYDAGLVVAGFSSRLRDQVELGAVMDELADIASRSLGPSSVSLWLPVAPASDATT